MSQVILYSNKENSIISVGLADLFRQLRRPKIRIVAPVTIPLALAPRIAHLHEAHLMTLYLELMDRDYRVSMPLNHAVNCLVVCAVV